MPEQPDEPVYPYPGAEPYLDRDVALDWFSRQPGGNSIIDAHLTALGEILGPNPPVWIKAAVDASTGEPTVLVFEILGSVDAEQSWQTLIALQERILLQEDKLKQELKVDEPFRRVVVSLGGEPSDWSRLARELEEEQ